VRVELTADPVMFRDTVFPFLKECPLRNIAVLSVLERRVEVGPADSDHYLAVLDDGGVVTGAVIVVGKAAYLGELRAELAGPVARTLAGAAPGTALIEGVPDAVHAFARCWKELRGQEFRQTVAKRLHRLERLVPHHAIGTPRLAALPDLGLCLDWELAFMTDVGEEPRADTERLRQAIRAGQRWLWEVGGEPVSMVGHMAAIAGIGRVGPVYTPPAFRSRGFASALTTHVTKKLVDHGFDACLYTDLSNPTSNKVYAAIGYRPVADLLRLETTCQPMSTDSPGVSGT